MMGLENQQAPAAGASRSFSIHARRYWWLKPGPIEPINGCMDDDSIDIFENDGFWH